MFQHVIYEAHVSAIAGNRLKRSAKRRQQYQLETRDEHQREDHWGDGGAARADAAVCEAVERPRDCCRLDAFRLLRRKRTGHHTSFTAAVPRSPLQHSTLIAQSSSEFRTSADSADISDLTTVDRSYPTPSRARSGPGVWSAFVMRALSACDSRGAIRGTGRRRSKGLQSLFDGGTTRAAVSFLHGADAATYQNPTHSLGLRAARESSHARHCWRSLCMRRRRPPIQPKCSRLRADSRECLHAAGDCWTSVGFPPKRNRSART